MPRYYFDCSDNGRLVIDAEGMDLPGPEEARRAAWGVLDDIAKEEIISGDRSEFLIRVRDGDGLEYFTASVVLNDRPTNVKDRRWRKR
jgi:hypothetical protein